MSGPERRRMLLAGAGLALAATRPLPARADADAGLPLAVSLQDALAAAARRRQALVVLVSLDGCPFCRIVRSAYLAPMLREARQPIVQVDMASARPLLDAAGRRTTHGAQVKAWEVAVAPTVLFLGPDARELAPRLVGASIPEFYGAYLEERVQAANRAAG